MTSGDLHRYRVPVARDWIAEGLRHTAEREEQESLASEHRLHQTALIREKGPELLRRLVAEVGAALDEYTREARTDLKDIDFEVLPREGFCVTKATLPRVALECRP